MHDLNILWMPSTTPEELDRTLHWAAYLGYDTVALNHIIRKIPEGKIVNPLPKVTGPLSQSKSKLGDKSTIDTAIAPSAASRARFPKQILHRATLHISDPHQHHRLPQLAAAYDILALRPTTEKAFLAACNTISESSMISLDMTQRLGYYIKHKNAMTAVKRGVCFEVCYSHMLYAPLGSSYGVLGMTGPQVQVETDSAATARCFGNWEQLFTSTRGRGIVISSEAGRKLAMRSPASIRNLMALYGLPDEKGLQAQADMARLVVKNELLKRSSYAGVVEVVQPASRPEGEEMEEIEGTEKEDETAKNKNAKGKNKKGYELGERDVSSNTGGSKKRKAVESPAAGQAPAVSKRQAKKMRKAAREAQEGKS
ncbi:RNase P subunit p30 [Zalerion maritima]|uniref:RNase P subunit p30 n=1 Tax=Zalerion maritima TaxID=339359 RepID=A0AAD5RRG3_9PEZI|nr:RNase P subunit p30 [Zalerion maritima]